jgi:hypothetical protein
MMLAMAREESVEPKIESRVIRRCCEISDAAARPAEDR